MYKWNDFLTKLAGTTNVSEVHKLLIKQKFLEILKTNYSKMVPNDCRIVLAPIDSTKNGLFVSIGSKNRTSSETDVPMLVENQLNDFFQQSDLKYIFRPETNKFVIDIPKSEVPTSGIAQRRQE